MRLFAYSVSMLSSGLLRKHCKACIYAKKAMNKLSDEQFIYKGVCAASE